MDVLGFRTEYVLGQSCFGYFPGHDKPMVRRGKEFQAMVEEQVAKRTQNPNKPPLDRTSSFPAPFDLLAENFERRELTKDELNELAAELAEKYDPANMAREELDSFLDDLVENGLLSKDELGTLGYHGYVTLGTYEEIGETSRIFTYVPDKNNPDWATYGHYRFGATLSETNGDALAYVKVRILYRPVAGPAAWLDRAREAHSNFTMIANIFEAVQKQREA